MESIPDGFVIHPMLRELRRFPNTKGSRVGGARWDRWAQHLIGRHTRMLAQLGMLALTLVGRGALVCLINERWNLLSQRLYPKIRLAIQLTQRQAVSQGSIPLEVLWQRLYPQIRSAVQLTQRQASSQISIRLAVHDRSPSSSTPEREIVVRSTPLHFVFQRLRQVNEFTQVRRQNELTHQNARSFVQRMTRQTQRVENWVAGKLALIARQTPGFAAPQSVAAMENRKGTVPGVHVTRAKRTGTSIHNIPASQPLNIEALTDQVVQQIDRRMTAWRERMGKI
jgi:hypothetical protein